MKKCMEHTWTRGKKNDLFERCRWCGETRNLGSVAPSSPVETTGADSGTSEQRWDLDAPYATWDLLDLIAYIDHWRDQCAALTVEVERQQVWAAKYWRERQSARAEVEDLTLDLEAANAMIGRVQAVLTHCHADTCATELSPHAGYDCTCWRGDLIAALEATP